MVDKKENDWMGQTTKYVVSESVRDRGISTTRDFTVT